MGKGFIDKKNSLSYQLVYRPQKEKIVNEDASEMVLKEIHSGNSRRNVESIDESTKNFKESINASINENVKYGVYYDDDYNYLKHLKPMGSDPSGVFIKAKQSFLPEEPEFDPNMDPEVYETLYALDDEEYLTSEGDGEEYFDFLNSQQVPSNLKKIQKTQNTEYDQEMSQYQISKEIESEQDSPDSLEDFEVYQDQKTNFSMSSSAMFRNANLTLLDNRFEKVLETYEEEDEDDLGQDLDSERINHILDEFLTSTETIGRKQRVIPKRDTLQDTLRDNLQNLQLRDEDSSSEISVESIKEQIREEWDCESILSTFSNIYNRPTILKKAPKAKISLKPIMKPIIETEEESESEKGILFFQFIKLENLGIARSKKESAEEKKARKQAIKAQRRDRRAIKKATTVAFMQEKLKV